MAKVISTSEEQTMSVTLEEGKEAPVTVTFRFSDDVKATRVDVPGESISLEVLQQAIGAFLEAHPEFAA